MRLLRVDFSGDALAAVWGTSSTDVWAVGANDAILHHDCRGHCPREAHPSLRAAPVSKP